MSALASGERDRELMAAMLQVSPPLSPAPSLRLPRYPPTPLPTTPPLFPTPLPTTPPLCRRPSLRFPRYPPTPPRTTTTSRARYLLAHLPTRALCDARY
eukprot:1397908-Rhodomonas_salina.1